MVSGLGYLLDVNVVNIHINNILSALLVEVQFPAPECKCVLFFSLLALLVSVRKCKSKVVILVLLF